MKFYSFLCIFIFVSTGLSFSETFDASQVYRMGQKTYEAALDKSGQDRALEMLKAAEIFQRLVEQGEIENGYLYYNIGNAYFEAGEKGKALLYYKKSKRYIPAYKDLNYNLEQVKRDLKVMPPPKKWYDSMKMSLFFWHYLLGIQGKQILFFTVFSLFWGVVLMSFFIKHLFVRVSIIFSLLITLLTGISYSTSTYHHFIKLQGVVIEPSADTHKGPSFSYEKFYEQNLSEGTIVEVLETVKGWIKVEVISGDQFWIPRDQVGII